jgi:hypothetical protein
MVFSDVDIKRCIAQEKIKITSNLRRMHVASRSASEFKG